MEAQKKNFSCSRFASGDGLLKMQLHLQYVVVVKMRFQCVLLRS